MFELCTGAESTYNQDHAASGCGQLSLDYVRFRQNRIEEMAGSLQAGPGMMGRSLITAASQRLGLVQQEDLQPRFAKYLPTARKFINYVEDYPYPYVIAKLCWEMPTAVPLA